MDLLKLLFIFILFLGLPLAEVARIPLGQTAITLMDIGVILLSLVWLTLKIKNGNTKSKLIKPIAIFTGTLLLSLLVNLPRLTSSEFIISSLYLVRWILYALVFFVVRDLPDTFKKTIPNFLKLSGGLILAIGFILYTLYPDLRNLRYLGWDEHLYRNFSTFLDPNFAGEFFVLYFIMVFESLDFKKITSKVNILNCVLSVLSVISILITFSRSAYISFIVVIIALTLIRKQIKALAIILLFIFGIFLISNFTFRSEGTNLLREASGKARVDSIKNALTIFKDNPILGVGFDAYRYAQTRYGFINESKMLIHSAAGTDNSFLFILSTSGVLGFVAFLYFLYSLFKFSWKSPVLFISLISLCIDSLFLNSLFYPPFMLWIWILAGLKKID